MFAKISFKNIVAAHVRTLSSYRTGEIMALDIILFYGIPFAVSLLLIWFGIKLDKDIVANMIAAMSIFGGFLLNLLAIVYSLIDTIKKNIKNDPDFKLKKDILSQVHVNISYNILVSILLVVLLILTYFLPACVLTRPLAVENIKLSVETIGCSISLFVQIIVYTFLANFLLTLLMILQRIYVLMKRKIGDDE